MIASFSIDHAWVVDNALVLDDATGTCLYSPSALTDADLRAIHRRAADEGNGSVAWWADTELNHRRLAR